MLLFLRVTVEYGMAEMTGTGDGMIRGFRFKQRVAPSDPQGVSPITHFLVGWTVATSVRLEKRDRALVALASVVPDVDGLGIVADFVTTHAAQPTEWWGTYHHVLGHNIGAALVVTAISLGIARRRVLTSALVLLSFHLHLLGDIVGSRGPDGYQWPIPYLSPFSEAYQIVWSGQWALNAWPNFAITALLLAGAFYVAWRHAESPLELVSQRSHVALVDTLRTRFGAPRAALDVGCLAE